MKKTMYWSRRWYSAKKGGEICVVAGVEVEAVMGHGDLEELLAGDRGAGGDGAGLGPRAVEAPEGGVRRGRGRSCGDPLGSRDWLVYQRLSGFECREH